MTGGSLGGGGGPFKSGAGQERIVSACEARHVTQGRFAYFTLQRVQHSTVQYSAYWYSTSTSG